MVNGSWPAAEPPRLTEEVALVSLFLALIIVAIVLGIIGAVVDGLLFLLFIGIVLLVADLVYITLRTRRSARHRPAR
jgi:hypothetical protein